MPGMNDKGPAGTGPRSGGGKGVCQRNGATAAQGQESGQGQGRGQRQGQGRGPGQGRGLCRMVGTPVVPTSPASKIGKKGDADPVLKDNESKNQDVLDGLMAEIKQLEAGYKRDK